ncbi:flagellar basal body P-ring formation protein FlgA [Salipiger pacificus]|uniref:Flagella basal body P-ring formation protein FlgA n=2 Tax=Salipiger mangrovisoli TaxID=2865933 RepID=A0ABR9WX92_9RHOB|nr:flagellar basal body P-ring formation chaperone FlgA [Salipiger mangrovisoli]MBE9635910.1 flagellar basal body P-ring formation protein FlgA [Salipiger mangrovisoli]
MWALLLLFLAGGPAQAESVMATRTIRAQEVIAPDAVRLDPRSADGAAETLQAVIGRETQVAVYAGQPVLAAQLSEPALIDRNQLVELVYEHAGLRIVTEGRAMSRGSAGERIRVMNLSSRSLLVGTIRPDGQVDVSPE